jgi:hypothetical protein
MASAPSVNSSQQSLTTSWLPRLAFAATGAGGLVVCLKSSDTPDQKPNLWQLFSGLGLIAFSGATFWYSRQVKHLQQTHQRPSEPSSEIELARRLKMEVLALIQQLSPPSEASEDPSEGSLSLQDQLKALKTLIHTLTSLLRLQDSFDLLSQTEAEVSNCLAHLSEDSEGPDNKENDQQPHSLHERLSSLKHHLTQLSHSLNQRFADPRTPPPHISSPDSAGLLKKQLLALKGELHQAQQLCHSDGTPGSARSSRHAASPLAASPPGARNHLRVPALQHASRHLRFDSPNRAAIPLPAGFVSVQSPSQA